MPVTTALCLRGLCSGRGLRSRAALRPCMAAACCLLAAQAGRRGPVVERLLQGRFSLWHVSSMMVCEVHELVVVWGPWTKAVRDVGEKGVCVVSMRGWAPQLEPICVVESWT